MRSRTIVIQMEITKRFGLARHRGVLNLTMVKAINLLDPKFHLLLKSMMLLSIRMQLQIIKWWLQLRRNSKGGSQPMGRKWFRDLQ